MFDLPLPELRRYRPDADDHAPIVIFRHDRVGPANAFGLPNLGWYEHWGTSDVRFPVERPTRRCRTPIR